MSDVPEYDEIARRFFAEFLALKVDLNLGRVSKPPDWDKEMKEQKRAATEFKEAAAHMAGEVHRLEEALALAEEQLVEERGKLNKALIALHAAKERLKGAGIKPSRGEERGYSFEEHLDPESRKLFRYLMSPPGTAKGGDDD